jgi:hypothetical protein
MERNPLGDALYLACMVVAAYMALELASSGDDAHCVCGDPNCKQLPGMDGGK